MRFGDRLSCSGRLCSDDRRVTIISRSAVVSEGPSYRCCAAWESSSEDDDSARRSPLFVFMCISQDFMSQEC
jgi:hypothetical protein